MGPAASIIEICGGAEAVAAWLKLDPSTVHRWTYTKSKGGSDGYIPSTYHETILLRARAEKKRLKPEHFFPTAFPQFAGTRAARREAANANQAAPRRRKVG